MKEGFRVYDSDTHVNPAAEVLERYVDPGFRPRLAELQDDPGSRHPVSSFAFNQMTNHIEHAPGVFTFASASPHVRQIAQKCIKCSRSAAEDGNRIREVVFRRVRARCRFCFHEPILSDQQYFTRWGA